MLLTRRWLAGADGTGENGKKPPSKAAAEGSRDQPVETSASSAAVKKRKRAAEEGGPPKDGKKNKNRVEALGNAGGDAGDEPAPAQGEKNGKLKTEEGPEALAMVEPAAEAKAHAKAKSKSKKGKKKKRRKKKRANEHTKEPAAAAAYLNAWAATQAGEDDGGWRFNKATQAWLLRHAYDPEKIAKGAFKLLLRYLEGLQGQARERARREAAEIVRSKGAPPAQEPDVGAPESRSQKKGKRAAADASKGDAEAADVPPSSAAEPTEAEKAAEAAEQKSRLKRARGILMALGGAVDGAAAE